VSPVIRWLLPLPVVLPLLGAGATMALARWRTAQRVVSLGALTGAVAASAALLALVERDGVATVQVGDWPAPLGITLVADLMAALLLLVGLVTVLGVLVYAMGQPGTEQRFGSFHPVYLVLAAGVSLSFLTGDLFNLFVAFELMLVASYVLITLGGTRAQVRSGMTYVVINLLASTLFVTAVAFLYASTGTVNLADLAGRIAELDPGLRTAFALLLLITFGIKSAIFPLFFWLPDSYPTAATPVTAVFAGLLTKVGVYTILRTQTLLFPEGSRPGTAILVLASLTMVIGVLGAIAQDDVKRILSFHIVSQIGYMIFGLGLFTVAGVAGAIVFVIHQIPVKTALFMAGGLIEHAGGTRSCRGSAACCTAPR
jgi:multicomponent Na+:H+ antiporter subunit D